jgi:hypothetical protein
VPANPRRTYRLSLDLMTKEVPRSRILGPNPRGQRKRNFEEAFSRYNASGRKLCGVSLWTGTLSAIRKSRVKRTSTTDFRRMDDTDTTPPLELAS